MPIWQSNETHCNLVFLFTRQTNGLMSPGDVWLCLWDHWMLCHETVLFPVLCASDVGVIMSGSPAWEISGNVSCDVSCDGAIISTTDRPSSPRRSFRGLVAQQVDRSPWTGPGSGMLRRRLSPYMVAVCVAILTEKAECYINLLSDLLFSNLVYQFAVEKQKLWFSVRLANWSHTAPVLPVFLILNPPNYPPNSVKTAKFAFDAFLKVIIYRRLELTL